MVSEHDLTISCVFVFFFLREKRDLTWFVLVVGSQIHRTRFLSFGFILISLFIFYDPKFLVLVVKTRVCVGNLDMTIERKN